MNRSTMEGNGQEEFMPEEEKIAITIMLALLGIGLFFVQTTGSTHYHLTIKDKPLGPYAKPMIWGLIGIVLIKIWLFT